MKDPKNQDNGLVEFLHAEELKPKHVGTLKDFFPFIEDDHPLAKMRMVYAADK